MLGLKENSHQPSQPKMAAGFSEHKSRGRSRNTAQLPKAWHQDPQFKAKGDEVRTPLLLNKVSQLKEKALFSS